MPDYHQPLFPSTIYHLFSRAVGNEKLFIEEKNYFYFLQKLDLHTSDIADILTYSLLPNHFHLLVKIKSMESIALKYEKVKKKPLDPLIDNIPDFIMERFSNLLNSYTKSINKTYNRKGSLFMDYLRRSKVENDADLTSLIFYVHNDAVHHGYSINIGDWKFDGYRSLLSTKPTRLPRDEVLNWFGGRDQFIALHQKPIVINKAIFCEI